MGPRVPFAPALLTLSLHITLHIYFISSRLFILLYVTGVMVNKAVKEKKTSGTGPSGSRLKRAAEHEPKSWVTRSPVAKIGFGKNVTCADIDKDGLMLPSK